jgi:hypothetical protein
VWAGGGIGSVTNSEDTVVKVLSASLGNDTGSVHLEGNLVGLNGDRDWSKSDQWQRSVGMGCLE